MPGQGISTRCLLATPTAIAEAAERLRAGALVAFPTETVYGLGADGLNPAAVARIYEAKGRPSNNPLILHVPDLESARQLVSHWPPEAQALAEQFWPGPLTLVLPAAPEVPEIVRAGNPTVALRCPSHPVALALLKAVGRPLAAPSANRSTEISPTLAAHVIAGLAGRIELVLDGGATSAGLESTIVQLALRPFKVLRPGPLSPSALEAVLGPLERWEGQVQPGALQSAPGMSERHYAPRTPLRLVMRENLQQALEACPGACGVLLGEALTLPDSIVQCVLPEEPDQVGTALYALLHELDAAGHRAILFQEPPVGDAWWAVRDRLRRAAAGTGGSR